MAKGRKRLPAKQTPAQRPHPETEVEEDERTDAMEAPATLTCEYCQRPIPPGMLPVVLEWGRRPRHLPDFMGRSIRRAAHLECDREHRGIKPKERKEPTTGAAPQEKPAAAGKKAPKERRGSLDTGRIFRLVKVNPRKQGTHGWKSWNLIRDGMTVMEYLAAGGRRNDLAWDIEHKHVEVRD